jgi:hypothetical protein
MGLRLPPYVEVEDVIICYQLSNAGCVSWKLAHLIMRMLFMMTRPTYKA